MMISSVNDSSSTLQVKQPLLKPFVHFQGKKKTAQTPTAQQPQVSQAQVVNMNDLETVQKLLQCNSAIGVIRVAGSRTSNPLVMNCLIDALQSIATPSELFNPIDHPVFPKTGYSLLHSAVSRGEIDLVAVLMARGANPLKFFAENQNAFDIAHHRIREVQAKHGNPGSFKLIENMLQHPDFAVQYLERKGLAEHILPPSPSLLANMVPGSAWLAQQIQSGWSKLFPNKESNSSPDPASPLSAQADAPLAQEASQIGETSGVATHIVETQDSAVQTDDDGFDLLKVNHQTLQKDFNALQETLVGKADELKQLYAQGETLQLRFKEEQNRVQNLTSKLEEVNKQNNLLQQESQHKKLDYKKREQQFNQLQREKKDLQNELSNAKKQQSRLLDTLQKRESQVNNFKHQLETEHEKIKSLKAQLEKQRQEEAEHLALQKQHLSIELKNRSEEIETLKAQLVALKQESSKLPVLERKTSPETPMLQEQMERLSRGKKALQDKLNAKQKELNHLKADYNRVKDEAFVEKMKSQAFKDQLAKLIEHSQDLKAEGRFLEALLKEQEYQTNVRIAQLNEQEILLDQMAQNAKAQTEALKILETRLAEAQATHQKELKATLAINHALIFQQDQSHFAWQTCLVEKDQEIQKQTVLLNKQQQTIQNLQQQLKELKQKESRFNLEFPPLRAVPEPSLASTPESGPAINTDQQSWSSAQQEQIQKQLEALAGLLILNHEELQQSLQVAEPVVEQLRQAQQENKGLQPLIKLYDNMKSLAAYNSLKVKNLPEIKLPLDSE